MTTCPAYKQLSDVLGDHALTYGSDGESIAKLNQLKDTIYSHIVSGKLAPIIEEQAIIFSNNACLANFSSPLAGRMRHSP